MFNRYRGNKSSNNRRSFGNSSFRGRRNFSGRRSSNKRKGFAFNESMFIKEAKPISEDIPYVPITNFASLDINKQLKDNIKNKNFNTPTPIQDKAITPILDGKDFLGIADTGTGKTAAFLIPMINKVMKDRETNVLIISPTRELAEQTNKELFTLTKGLGIFSVLTIGGSSINNQIYNLRRGFNFVIGTPGRLKDLYDRKVLNLNIFNSIVLDEVDRMLDMGFVNEIKFLISLLPSTRQSLCFSATIEGRVEKIIDSLLKPGYVKVSIKTGETAANVAQNIVRIQNHDEKLSKLEELLATEGFDKVLVFANTKGQVDKIDQYLYERGFKVDSIHGERRQNQRRRSVDNFKTGRAKILVATDVAARGLDINNVTHVINYDIPVTYEDYIHRVGRTGRANRKGMALTFVESSGMLN